MTEITTYEERDFPAHIHKLKELYLDLFSEGKGFRAKLVWMVSQHLDLSKEQIICLQKVIEYIHNSSLLHDDLIDKSPLRRGKQAAWLKYSPEYAVLAGDYLLAKVISLLCEQKNVGLVSYTSDVIMNLLEGEWLQDDIKKKPNLNQQEMTHIHDLKTASLKKWCLRAPFYLAGNDSEKLHQELENLGRLMGILFQRADDLLDYNIRNYEEKEILSDHKAGYMNSFAIHLMNPQSDENKINFLKLTQLDDIIDFIGINQWEEAILSFDKENEKFLREYNQTLENIHSLLSPNEQSLTETLLPLGPLLYWRK